MATCGWHRVTTHKSDISHQTESQILIIHLCSTSAVSHLTAAPSPTVQNPYSLLILPSCTHFSSSAPPSSSPLRLPLSLCDRQFRYSLSLFLSLSLSIYIYTSLFVLFCTKKVTCKVIFVFVLVKSQTLDPFEKENLRRRSVFSCLLSI